jgi:hypothetical protein
LEEIIFNNFNIFENNIISVELAKVLRASPPVLSMSLWIIELNVLVYLFVFSTNKIVTGAAYKWGVLIANHLDQ